jgi:fumarate reductase subunit C
MHSARPARTRTAPPRLPDRYPMEGRYRAHLIFGATGLLYLMLGFIILGAVGSLGTGAGEWKSVLEKFRSPVYIAFHAISLAAICFVGVRFFSLFPKAQPPRIGPLRPPPAKVLLAALYAAWIGVTLAFSAVLAGAIFR